MLPALTVSVGPLSRDCVELGGGSGGKGRQGEVIYKPRREVNSRALRHQRGTAFFHAYFDDLARAAAAAAESTMSPAAVLFVDLSCWVGDGPAALVEWWVKGQKLAEGSGGSAGAAGPKVYGLFHDDPSARCHE